MGKIPDKLHRFALKAAYALFNGFSYIFRPVTRGVLVGVWWKGRVLVIRNSYYRKYSLPGGFVKPGEDLKSAAIRELREEVSIPLENETLRFAGSATFRIHYRHEELSYFEVDLSRAPAVVIDNREVVWAGFMTPADVMQKNLTLPARRYFSLKKKCC